MIYIIKNFIPLFLDRKTIYARCKAKTVEIAATINYPKKDDDEISWICNPLGVIAYENENNGFPEKCTHKTNGTELEFGQELKLKLDVFGQLQCNSE